MLFYDWRFAERIQCTLEEKRECFDLILDLRKYATMVHKNGFLALEKELQSLDDPFLLISFQMGIDGVSPEFFRDIQERRILVDNCKGKELLKRVIITECVASLLSEDPYHVLHYKVLSYLGEDGHRWAIEEKLDLIGV